MNIKIQDVSLVSKYNFVLWLVNAKLKLEKIGIYHRLNFKDFYLANKIYIYQSSCEIYFTDNRKQYFIFNNNTMITKETDFIITYNLILKLFNIANTQDIYDLDLEYNNKKLLADILKYLSSTDKEITYDTINFLIYINDS